MKWPADKKRIPEAEPDCWSLLVSDHTRNTADLWMIAIDRNQLVDEIGLEDHVIVEKQPDIAIGDCHRAVACRGSARDSRITNVLEIPTRTVPVLRNSEFRLYEEPARIIWTLVDDDEGAGATRLGKQASCGKLKILRPVLGRNYYADSKGIGHFGSVLHAGRISKRLRNVWLE